MRFPLLLLTACLAGCFTEVGNAEDERLVQADFRVDYGPRPPVYGKTAIVGTATIANFRLLVREAEFHLFDSTSMRRAEYHLWKGDPESMPVDFTGRDTDAVLPNQKVGDIDPQNLRLACVIPASRPLNPDTLVFDRFADRAYIKGHYRTLFDSVGFLFALPAGAELNLMYSKEALEDWYADGRYRCDFIFYANSWIAAADLSAAARMPDATGRPVILLDSTHNQAAYSALLAALPKSFNTSMVFLSNRP